ncbi:MAG: hypothetical protein M1497_13025 [Nitrospirae bacterium]|nr:hypothetical protein [Nitrospirota bacterium]
MVDVDIRVIETVAAFASVVALCVLLKWKGIVTETHESVLARLLTQAALPAVIFSQLATHPAEPRQYLMALTIIVAALVLMVADPGGCPYNDHAGRRSRTVFASRYRCDGTTASALVMSHVLLSMAIIPISFAIINR